MYYSYTTDYLWGILKKSLSTHNDKPIMVGHENKWRTK